jgi:hypothetical protein
MVRARVSELAAKGLKALDAAHIAFAETAGCPVVLTCDDRLMRQAKNLALSLRVINPVQFMNEVSKNAKTSDCRRTAAHGAAGRGTPIPGSRAPQAVRILGMAR